MLFKIKNIKLHIENIFTEEDAGVSSGNELVFAVVLGNDFKVYYYDVFFEFYNKYELK
jgi:hypothetical protein